MAPVSDPRLVMAIVIDEPAGGEHFGGLVAAPVFSRVMQGALRILDIAPDKIPELESSLVTANSNANLPKNAR